MDRKPREVPDFIDKGTTQSLKETFCAALLLWVHNYRRPAARQQAPIQIKVVKVAVTLLLYAIYVKHR